MVESKCYIDEVVVGITYELKCRMDFCSLPIALMCFHSELNLYNQYVGGGIDGPNTSPTPQ
jgi:hypothetical protein